MSNLAPSGDLGDRFSSARARLGSFRTRLRLFFVLIVIVPMVAVTFVVFRLIADSENGQANARGAAREEAAISLYYDVRARADRRAAVIGRDRQLAAALRRNDPAAVAAAARRASPAPGRPPLPAGR